MLYRVLRDILWHIPYIDLRRKSRSSKFYTDGEKLRNFSLRNVIVGGVIGIPALLVLIWWFLGLTISLSTAGTIGAFGLIFFTCEDWSRSLGIGMIVCILFGWLFYLYLIIMLIITSVLLIAVGAYAFYYFEIIHPKVKVRKQQEQVEYQRQQEVAQRQQAEIRAESSRNAQRLEIAASILKYSGRSILEATYKSSLSEVHTRFGILIKRCEDTKKAISKCKLLDNSLHSEVHSEALSPISELEEYSYRVVSSFVSKMDTFDNILKDVPKSRYNPSDGENQPKDDYYYSLFREQIESISKLEGTINLFILELDRTIIEMHSLGDADHKKAQNIIQSLKKLAREIKKYT